MVLVFPDFPGWSGYVIGYMQTMLRLYSGKWELEVNGNLGALHVFSWSTCWDWLGTGKTGEPAYLIAFAS